jgi:HlyD family secretion protein
MASISATGTLNPVITVQVGTQVSGMIEKLLADFNSTVVPGQQLAQIDQASFRAKVVQAEASLDTARAEVNNTMANVHNVRVSIDTARADMASRSAQRERARVAIVDTKRILERQQALFARGLLPRSEVETAQTTYDTAVAQYNAAQADVESAETKLRAAQAQLAAAEAQVQKANGQVRQSEAVLEQARLDLEHTIIRSPVTGTVITRSVDVGQTVAAIFSAPTLFTIALDLTKMQVDTNVSEADISAVAAGQETTFTVDAYPGQVMHGTVREIRSAPIVVQNVVNCNAVIAVDNPRVEVETRHDCHRVDPRRAAAERVKNPQGSTPLSAATDAAGARAVHRGLPEAAAGGCVERSRGSRAQGVANHPQSLDADP